MAEARLYTQYKEEIVPNLKEEFSYDNIMAIPKLRKIVINVGAGDAINDAKYLDTVVENVGSMWLKRSKLNMVNCFRIQNRRSENGCLSNLSNLIYQL